MLDITKDIMSSKAIDNTLFLARQPIFDNHLNLFAYELLFRSNQNNQSGIEEIDGDKATSQVITTTFLEFGTERVLSGKLGFINLTRAYITGEIPLPFDQRHVVLEMLEDIEIDDEVIAGIQNLSEQGFTIALDDFIYHPDTLPLIDCADIIKIDLLALTDDELAEHVTILKKHNVKLLAEKVESQEQYQRCKQLGFDYYQGYFFCKPTILDDQPLPDNKLTSMRILNDIQRNDIVVEEIETLLKQDPTLSYKLLRYLNSAAFALPKKVESLKQAVLYLGLDTIKSWATIIVFSNVSNKTSDGLLTTALVRAKMSESIASKFDCDPETAFMLGLFSTADALFNKTMPSLLQSMPITESIKQALQSGEGNLGRLLNFIRVHERGSLTVMPQSLDIGQINHAFINATNWAYNTSQGLNNTP